MEENKAEDSATKTKDYFPSEEERKIACLDKFMYGSRIIA